MHESEEAMTQWFWKFWMNQNHVERETPSCYKRYTRMQLTVAYSLYRIQKFLIGGSVPFSVGATNDPHSFIDFWMRAFVEWHGGSAAPALEKWCRDHKGLCCETQHKASHRHHLRGTDVPANPAHRSYCEDLLPHPNMTLQTNLDVYCTRRSLSITLFRAFSGILAFWLCVSKQSKPQWTRGFCFLIHRYNASIF